MADQADKEYQHRGQCSCGTHDWKELDWCEQHKEECFFGEACAGDPFEKKPKESCPALRKMLECKACGAKVEREDTI